jgi:hypothetical protein
MNEQNKEFEALYARDGQRIVRESASVKQISEYWFLQGTKHGETKGMRPFGAMAETLNESLGEVVSPTGARAL